MAPLFFLSFLEIPSKLGSLADFWQAHHGEENTKKSGIASAVPDFFRSRIIHLGNEVRLRSLRCVVGQVRGGGTHAPASAPISPLSE